MVSPEGEVGWYADWYNNGAYGTPQWESYVLDEAIPQILQRYKILAQRRYHALFGISMGGLGAAYLGGRLPGFFGSVGVLSGFVDTQIAPSVVSVSMDELSGAPIGSVVGPENGFYATGHNPTALTANLKYTRVFMSAGKWVPTAADGTGGGEGNAEEAGVIRPMSDAYASALRGAGVDLVYHTHNGTAAIAGRTSRRSCRTRSRGDRSSLPSSSRWTGSTRRWRRTGSSGTSDTHSPSIRQRSCDSPAPGSRLQISAAGSPVTLTTSRGCVLEVATPGEPRIPAKSCTGRNRGPACSRPWGGIVRVKRDKISGPQFVGIGDRMPPPRSRPEPRRYLAALSRPVFSAGMSWRVVDAKWDWHQQGVRRL